ncbi:MAG: glycosyltransferase family 2 protein, partial [Myxococcota bacterium]
MAKLTLCMIVRDEEAMLADCLASARRAVDRMVVVDTGSTDGTREMIRRFGAELVEHAWTDDFSAARNAGLARIDSGYVLMLDADERLTARGARVLRAVARRGKIDLGLLPLHDAASLDARPEQVLSGRARRGEPMLLPRLMRRTPDLRYEGIVHESVAAWAIADRRTEVIQAPIVHYGAVPELRTARGKDERNRLLL